MLRHFSRLGAGWLLLVFLGALTITITFGSDAIGQSRTTCALAGRVEDQSDAPVPGATCEIRSPALIGGPRSVSTDRQGRFRFAELSPGRYEMTVSMPGFEPVHTEGIQLSVGMTAEIPVEIGPSHVQEEVTVQADSKLIDPTTSAMSTVLPPDYIKNIPTDRDTSHILDLAPGINIQSAYGASEESGISYEMDGVDVSDPQAGAPWSFFNYSLVDQVELVGLGAPAEYGQFTGVVFNTVTKSGTNDFRGSAEVFFTNHNLTAASSGPADVAAQIEQQAEGNLHFGGPIRKDKLWYFSAAQYLRNLQSEGGPIETEKDPRAFLKLTFAPRKNTTLEGWIAWAHTKITGRNGDAFTPLEATAGENNPEVIGNLSWKSILSQKSILTIAWGGYSGHHHFDPHSGFSTPGHEDAQTGLASVNASQFGVLDRIHSELNVSLAHHATNLIAGYHDFKVGSEVEYSKVRDRYGYPGNAFFSDNQGPEEDPSTGEEDFFTLAYRGGGYNAHGIGERLSLFAQDSWRISNRFTLNPGVRLDIDRGKVSNGQTVFRTNSFAPRIGFAWDLGEDGHSLLRAHYGRYYEALYAAYYYYVDPGAFFPLTTEKIFNESGFREPVTSIDGQQYGMDPHIRQPHLDQYIVGFDQQLPYGIVLSATAIYRKNADLIETVSRDGLFVPVDGTVPDTAQRVRLYDHLNPNTDVLIYTNPPGLNRTYRGLMLTATRHLRGNWQLMASYVYSRTRGNIDNLGFDETGLGGNTPFFEGHFLDTPNSLVNAQGRLTHDQEHQIKLQGTWIVPPLHTSFSANYTYYSGDTWTARTDCLLTDDGNGVIGDGIVDCHEFPQGPVVYFGEPRGSRRLPAANQIDLRAEWEHDFARQRQVSLFVDIFNLTNQTRATQVETLMDEQFGQPATLNFPRNARFGVSFSW